MRTLDNIFRPGAESDLPQDVAEREDIKAEKIVYCESIKKFKLSRNEDDGTYDLEKLGEHLVYSNMKHQLLLFLKDEERQLGFV